MDPASYLKFVAALVFVLGLILGLAWLARRFGLLGHANVTSGKNQRLSVVEVRNIDPRHRLVLVRRDDVEHLLLIGPSGGSVVEAGSPTLPGSATGAHQAESKS